MNKEKITHHGKQHELEKEVVGVWGFGVECMATATLTIDNPLPFHAYLENIEGHYIKGVASWQEAHEELIDLVQAMLEELASSEYGSRYDDEIDLLLARITDNYSDGTFIAIEAGYYVREQRIKVDVFGSRRAEMWVVQDEGLADKIHLKELQFPR